ncbi:MAG: BspA family leucine-rich repeat surface protein, partial [Prevotella sp.]|nr:BspA family leucine-rich repeat surface protein [Prevotella sp.]
MKKVLTIIALLASTMNALWAAEAYVVKSTDGKTLTFYHDDNKATREGTVYGMNDNWGSWNINITAVIFDSSFAHARPTTTKSWFSGCYYLQCIEGLQYLNTSEVTDMSYMFDHCRGLTNLDLSNFNTSNVTDMSKMFYYCSGLTSLNVSNFDTQNVTNMSSMFD